MNLNPNTMHSTQTLVSLSIYDDTYNFALVVYVLLANVLDFRVEGLYILFLLQYISHLSNKNVQLIVM